jgi:hypothetical protein
MERGRAGLSFWERRTALQKTVRKKRENERALFMRDKRKEIDTGAHSCGGGDKGPALLIL